MTLGLVLNWAIANSIVGLDAAFDCEFCEMLGGYAWVWGIRVHDAFVA